MEREIYCPTCEGETTFWLAASTELHLGTKTKWRCSECERGVVRIGEDVDTAAA
ncbi:DUF7838 family putative zinc beta-ribbon protein [Natranaeroarchaeum sulfidigenes]|uniref:Zn finger protein n=1 Tax=Natranaeroarchaeum sulfidigenes TaxID=2784880 RepID=A0A897MPQ2_9EURY|nr:hypothetical protein [Natranaeroarchaeum sulfidigenes]QSG01948.1 Zn finger protein [Natranaeroarchaeum sulfidigenes]